jgi:hypothetical protein
VQHDERSRVELAAVVCRSSSRFGTPAPRSRRSEPTPVAEPVCGPLAEGQLVGLTHARRASHERAGLPGPVGKAVMPSGMSIGHGAVRVRLPAWPLGRESPFARRPATLWNDLSRQ